MSFFVCVVVGLRCLFQYVHSLCHQRLGMLLFIQMQLCTTTLRDWLVKRNEEISHTTGKYQGKEFVSIGSISLNVLISSFLVRRPSRQISCCGNFSPSCGRCELHSLSSASSSRFEGNSICKWYSYHEMCTECAFLLFRFYFIFLSLFSPTIQRWSKWPS